MKTIILPGNLLYPGKPDDMFEKEYEAAKQYGKVFFFNIEDFSKNTEILTRLPYSDTLGEEIFYHGWMMNSDQYQRFYLTLKSKGYELTNNHLQHAACNYFNGWYPSIRDMSPYSIMIDNNNLRTILDAALSLRKETSSALIIKDAVKSLKHDWFEACFIPEHANALEMAKIIGTFLEAKQSHNDLNLPVVLRKFENLKSLGTHAKSKMPISYEFRTYIRNGNIFYQSPYWEDKYPTAEEPPVDFVKKIANKIYTSCGSNLFTIDTAFKEDGTWICIEVGDGQVSMLPDQANKNDFFKKLLSE